MDEDPREPTDAGVRGATDTRTIHQFALEGERIAVDVSRVLTSKGERIELRASPAATAIRLDALGLESLSWQDAATVRDFAPADVEPGVVEAGTGERPPGEVLDRVTVTNEFAAAAVALVGTQAGDRLLIHGPKKGTYLLLGPRAAATVTRQTTDLVSAFLETPAGPE